MGGEESGLIWGAGEVAGSEGPFSLCQSGEWRTGKRQKCGPRKLHVLFLGFSPKGAAAGKSGWWFCYLNSLS